jgi:hypothetical protein
MFFSDCTNVVMVKQTNAKAKSLQLLFIFVFKNRWLSNRSSRNSLQRLGLILWGLLVHYDIHGLKE